MEIQQMIEKATLALSVFEGLTPDEIAQYLELQGIRYSGYFNSKELNKGCPIAQHINIQNMGVSRSFIFNLETNGVVIPLHENVRDFIDKFDDKYYPNLIAEE